MLRCVLVVFVWQGPVPWCHRHGTLANTPDSAISWLQEHLRTHHSSIGVNAEVSFGWHVHFDFPIPVDDDSNGPNVPDQDRLPPVSSLDTVSASIARAASDSSDLAAAHRVNLSGDTRVIANGLLLEVTHFYEASAPSCSLSVRFCVSRC